MKHPRSPCFGFFGFFLIFLDSPPFFLGEHDIKSCARNLTSQGDGFLEQRVGSQASRYSWPSTAR